MTPTTPVTVEQVPIDPLRPDPANPRRISEEEFDAVERSIREFGFVQPVLARREDDSMVRIRPRLKWNHMRRAASRHRKNPARRAESATFSLEGRGV